MEAQELERRERRTKVWLLLVSLATIGALLSAAIGENFRSQWYGLRTEYAAILQEKATDDLGKTAAEKFEVRIVQNFLPAVERADRCITCHAGIEDPRMVDQEQPFSTHPGRYLELHDPTKFGCTVCHDGQGRATSVIEGHGRAPHWEEPMRSKTLVTSSCTRCHSEAQVFERGGLLKTADGSRETPAAGIESLLRGRDLIAERGCLGCHKLDGKGGEQGPDLTDIGQRAAHGFDFSHIHHEEGEPKLVEDWLTEHFLNPTEVSPGSIMPAVANEEDAQALTNYMLSLGVKIPALAADAGNTTEAAPDGEKLYATYCSSCHGLDGRGGSASTLSTPSLNSLDALSVAGNDFYRLTIEQGRKGTQMPAWDAEHGNLTRNEIDKVVGYIRSWMPSGAPLEEISSQRGEAEVGESLYRGYCAGCHGLDGEGGVGISLNSPSFLSIADDAFLARSIRDGRPGTAMPSWRQLDAQAISDLIAHIRSWQDDGASFDDVEYARLLADTEQNIATGELLFGGYCASCHGDDLEGIIGPSLASPDFLAAVDDYYLYRAIVDGRPTTAMPAWRQLSAEDVGALMDYLRASAPALEKQPYVPTTPYERGHAGAGEVYFKQGCQSCHGEGGTGGVGPQLINPVFLATVSDQALAHWIGHGRAGTSMEGFLKSEQGPLQFSPSQISDIVAYIRQLGAAGSTVVVREIAGLSSAGEELYAGHCAACHGGQGEGASGPQLNNSEFLAAASNGFLAATIVLGRQGTAMQPMVAGHGVEGLGQIPPHNVADVVAFLRGWDHSRTWTPARKVTEVSEVAIEQGRESFGQYCASCHGHDGRGKYEKDGYAPALNNQEFLAAASDGMLLATIARGRTGTAMLGFGHGANGIVSLDGSQIANIVAFIRDWQQ
jgi:cbb3-type cytochrome c oxidase subunit III